MMRKETGYATIIAAAAGYALVSSSAAPARPADAVAPAIRAIFDKPMYEHSVWSLRVLDGNRPIIDLNSRRLLYVGSVRKIFSVGELLNAVGAAHTYNTPVYRTAVISHGVLHGNLILVASGDLTMGGRTNPDGSVALTNWDHNEADSLGNAVLTAPDPLAGYAKLARLVRASGITHVTGDVVIDDRLFQAFAFRGEFNVAPIFVNDDVVDVTVRPGGTPGAIADVRHRPHSAALRVINNLRVGAANSAASVRLEPETPQCIGKPGCAATVAGSIPTNFMPPLTGEPQLVQTVRIVQPANYARTVFIEQLKAAGVAVDAPAVEQNPVRLLPAQRSYGVAQQVAQLTGLPYGQDAKLVLKVSYNIGADTSLMLLGVRHNVRSMESALAMERRDLQTHWSVDPSQCHFVDGSGGGETTATAVAVTTMLQELARSREAQSFSNALPVLAVDGSLGFVNQFKRDRSLAGAAGNVRAKTGTYVSATGSGAMDLKAQALAGYITSKRGHHLTFALNVNGVTITAVSDVTKIFQDEGAIAALLWRDY